MKTKKNGGLFPIEKGIPPPLDLKKYPWRRMEVGDSFFAPNGSDSTLRSGASAAGKRLNRKFACRPVDGGTRVWRIE